MFGLSPREEEILTLLRSGKEYPVTRLAEELGVSAVTIRSDLRSLDTKGLIVRSHGKAVVATTPQVGMRNDAHTKIKEAIAKAAAKLVKDGDSIMITNGSTCSLIPRSLFGKQSLP